MRVLWMICSLICVILSSYSNTVPACQLPPDHDWYANAVIDESHTETVRNIGYCQGVSKHEGFYYFYGDDKLHQPRVGVIREYELLPPEHQGVSQPIHFKETGKAIKLMQNNQPLILHPTGLTWDESEGCYLGDTVDKIATIYQLDWEQALKDGNLDHAIMHSTKDNLAINGCRPCFVHIDKTYLATADYGNVTPMLRLYNPKVLSEAKETKEPGVLVKQFSLGSFNQNLYWDDKQKQIICIQNVIEGRGWQLEYLDFQEMLNGSDTNSAVVKSQRLTFSPHDELEGFLLVDQTQVILCTSSLNNNVTTGKIRGVTPFKSIVPANKNMQR